jgi:hypothetical protein
MRVFGLTSLVMLLCALTCGCRGQSRAAPSAGAVTTPASPARGGAQGPAEVTRRIVKTAELSVQTDAPGDALEKVTAFVRSEHGFVVSSETSRSSESDGTEWITISTVFRVPAPTFEETIAAVHALGTRISEEKISGQDVTEEYVDVEARIRAQRAVEESYLGILKDAKSIPDVIAVEDKLGGVRTEIERAEGRRRLLETETDDSTVTIHFSRRFDAMASDGPGFGRSLQAAGRDALTVTIAMVNGAIRVIGALSPIALFAGLPLWLYLRRRIRRRRAVALG